jgi:HlyD family secretion protein
VKPKKLALIIGGILVVAIILCAASSLLSTAGNAAMQNIALTLTPQGTPAAELAVRARGEVVPGTWTSLAFDRSGPIVKWLVEEGATVKAGDPLAQLDTTQLEFALRQAQADLDSAETKLHQAELNHTQDISDAQLSLRSAQARVGQTTARYPSLTQSEVELERARKAEADAATAYARAQDRPWEWISEDVRNVYTDNWNKAKQDLAIAEANVAARKGEQTAASRDAAALQTDVERARLKLAELERGIDPLLTMDVEVKKLLLERAQKDLESATLRAPFAGTVIKRQLRVGDWAQPGAAVAVLADLSTLQIETTDLDEWGATHIKPGYPAQITLTAFDDKKLSGRVVSVALRGETISSGDVVYKTVIVLDQPDPDLRWGMTVRITIPLEQK